PSPPDGPPKGTYFSLRNAEQPFPPRPPVTCRSTSSTNAVLMAEGRAGGGAHRAARCAPLRGLDGGGHDRDELAQPAAIAVFNVARGHGEQRVVLAAADVASRLDGRPALADEDLAALDELAGVDLD